ncbi:MAG: hypothetical protein ACTSV3_01100 [Candidatus Thorarchaeota archaeon]|nr:MAG: hypothetical protein DRP09_04690 [Candidatus Thorarchaeota archaeon]
MLLESEEVKELHSLIDAMQSRLVELFDQLGALRKKLDLMPQNVSEGSPVAVPLFSEVVPKLSDTPIQSRSEDTTGFERVRSVSSDDTPSQPDDATKDTKPPVQGGSTSSVIARVSRVLDPIAHELQTGQATADILLEYLESAKEYLIDDDRRKMRVARDIDIVLKFLRARGTRGIRPEERDNILKRMNRWKAHLVAYASAPAT